MTEPTGLPPWTAAIAASVAVAAVIGLAAAVTLLDDTDERSDPGSDTPPTALQTTDMVPATDASLVAVALEHLDPEPSGLDALYREDGQYSAGTVGGDIRFHADGGSDGDLLRVLAAPGEDEFEACEVYVNCVTEQTGSGVLTVVWEEMVPEEDPGFVAVILQRPDEYARALYAGPSITGDPRELDLEVSVDDLVAIVTDPRFGTNTSGEMVDAGEELGFP